jgi:hypothetical protein
MVELLVVIGITTIGFIALLNLQIGTIHGLGAARDMQGALTLADHVSQSMRLEALQWTPATPALSSVSSFKFLSQAPATTTQGSTSGWLVAYSGAGGSADLRIGTVGADPVYDAGILKEVGTTLNAHYCVHYRLTWIVPDILLRGDVRVLWARNRGDFGKYSQCPLGMENELHNVHTITTPVTILKNVFVKQV